MSELDPVQDLPVHITLGELDFEAMEKVVGAELDEERRNMIQQCLMRHAWEYEVEKLLLLRSKAWLRNLEKQLAATIEAMEGLGWIESDVFKNSGVDDQQERERLELLKRQCQELRKSLRPHNRHSPNGYLPLMEELEFEFQEAVGDLETSTGISHDDIDGRTGRFLNFAFVALKYLPREMGPSSHQALASAWEPYYARRNRQALAEARLTGGRPQWQSWVPPAGRKSVMCLAVHPGSNGENWAVTYRLLP